MASTVARLEAVLTADTRAFNMAMDSAEHKTKSFGGHLGGLAGTALKTAGVGGLGALAVALKIGVGEFMQGQKVAAQTNAVLKSTGGIANVSAKQVADLGTSLMKKSGVDDEVIKSGENMLLTFTNIRNETGKGNAIFTRSTKILLDMSVALGQDMSKSAIQLGKALNDPLKGISALARVGVTFSAAQKDQIKAWLGTGLSATQAAAGITKASSALTGAQNAAAAAARGVTAAQQGQTNAARALVSAHDSVKAASDRMTSAQDGLKAASDRMTSAQEKLKSSTLGVKDAKEALTAAQGRAKAAQEALTGARQRATQQLIDLKNAATDASLSERAATLGLAHAQENLAKVMADSTSTELDKQDAILGLDQAQQNLIESQQSSVKAQKASDDAQQKGIAGSKDLADARAAQAKADADVLKAQQALIDSHQKVADAVRGVDAATRGMAASQRGIAAAQRGSAAAQRALATAQDHSAAADRALADAQSKAADATQHVADAQKALTAAHVAAKPVTADTSNLLKAQKLILGELTKEFGGSAQAAGETFAGQINIARESLKNWLGTMVQDMIPSLQTFVEWVKTNWPLISATIKTEWETNIKPVLAAFISLAVEIVRVIRDNWPLIGPIVTGIATSVGDSLKALAAAIRLIVDLIHGDWAKAWVDFKAVVVNEVRAMTEPVLGLLTTLGHLGGRIVGAVAGPVGKAVDAITGLPELIAGAIRGGAGKIATSISGLFGTVTSTFSNIPGEVRSAINAAIGAISGFVDDAFGAAKRLGAAIAHGLSDGLDSALAGGGGVAKQFANAVIRAINDVITHINDLLKFTIKMPGPIPDIHVNPPDIPKIPQLAKGGPLGAGMPAIVGERGPELFVPTSSGTVVPNGGGMGPQVAITVNGWVGGDQQLADKIVNELTRWDRRSGGRLGFA